MFEFIASAAFALLTTAVVAQPGPVSFTVSGAKLPVPALQYRLVVDPLEQTPGNAAPVYLNGALLLRGFTDEESAQVDKWNALPIDQLPAPEVRTFLEKYVSAIKQFDIAARRATCSWDITLREQGFAALLPHLAELRKGARLLSLRARLQISEKRWDDAAYTLTTGLSLCQHLQDNALLIESLVGCACGQLMLERVREWSSIADSPNLYWAISALPRPMAPVGRIMKRETAGIFNTIPGMREVRGGKVSSQQFADIIAQLNSVQDSSKPEGQLATAALAATYLPKAREWLTAQGKSEKELNDMPAIEVVAQWWVADYIKQTDELNKWFSLPYHQGIEGLRASGLAFEQLNRGSHNPLYMIVPAVSRAYTSCAKFDREVAALQNLEVLRVRIASEGALPKSLDGSKDTPALDDPMTGKPFAYSVDGNTCVIESTQKEQKDSLRWEIGVK